MAQTETVIVRPVSYILLVLYKFIAGLFEVSIGISFGIFGNQFLRFYQLFELSHLREDPSIYVRTVEKAVPYLLDHRTYVIVFFLTFGMAKIIGAIGLWYEQYWAIQMMILLSALLLPFEIVDFLQRPTIFLAFYILANIAILVYLMHFNPHIRHIRHKHHLHKLAQKQNS
jgi:uncharacterized membrane protein (DUF2068 family)